jgi:hypothetical protein
MIQYAINDTLRRLRILSGSRQTTVSLMWLLFIIIQATISAGLSALIFLLGVCQPAIMILADRDYPRYFLGNAISGASPIASGVPEGNFRLYIGVGGAAMVGNLVLCGNYGVRRNSSDTNADGCLCALPETNMICQPPSGTQATKRPHLCR